MALLIGVFLSLASSVTGFIALNIQCLAQQQESPRPTLNLAGVLLNLLVGPLDLMAYTHAPQSLLAPVATFALVLNLVAAPRLYGTPVARRDAVATSLIICGTVACLLFGARGAEVTDDKEEIGRGSGPSPTAMSFYVMLVATAGVFLIWVLVALREVGGYRDALANASLGGILGSTTVVAGKGIGIALATPAWTPFSVARPVVLLLCLAPVHLYTLNRGLGRHSSVLMVPLTGAASLLANVFSGFLLYGDAPQSIVGFLGGLGVLVGGVLALGIELPAAVMEKERRRGSYPLPRRMSGTVSGDC
mmetsp:Transcript_53835/g.116367  ORF Transcript_53835/g.116367 Transcript_53835/m.116367 type:complete len:305 (-) Transcript_53835:5-919(-)